jgi:hypothetical protein
VRGWFPSGVRHAGSLGQVWAVRDNLEADKSPRGELGGEVEVGCGHYADHGVATGYWVVGKEQDGLSPGGYLHGALYGAFAGEFAGPAPFHGGSAQAQPDPV